LITAPCRHDDNGATLSAGAPRLASTPAFRYIGAMDGKDEIELKLQADPEAIATLLADPLVANADPKSRDQLSTYFDTPTHALRKAGLSLRIRRIGDRRIQTIKTEGAGAASLFARGEWERDIVGDVPELDDISAVIGDALAGGETPQPIFTVAVNRTSIVHSVGPNRIELVADQGRVLVGDRESIADQGRVLVGDRESPVCEIELELLDGDRAALFALAATIADRVPLKLGILTKSERGYALVADAPASSVKAEPIAPARDIDTAALFAIVAGSCLRQFRLNEDRLLETGAPEALHQARVGLRRLRSALSIFKTMVAGPELDRFQAELRSLAALLGRVRDVDVMIAKLDAADALDRLRTARETRFDAVRLALGSAPVRALMLDLVAWIAIGAWRDDDATADVRTAPATDFARETLDTLRRRVKRRGRHLAKLDADARHEVRIAGKKLRYAAEFFAGLYAGKKAGRRREAFLDALEDMQTQLGHLNDLASGRALFAELDIADADTILAAGKKGDPARVLPKAADAYDRLIDAKRFWR
jgi:inorganic triphosphatase YgiF